VLAGPVELDGDVAGMVEIETAELPPERRESPWPYLLGVLAPLAVYVAGAFIIRRRESLAALAALCVAASLGTLLVLGLSRVEGARRGAAQAVADEAHRQAATVRSLAPSATQVSPASWDYATPRLPLSRITLRDVAKASTASACRTST